MAAVAVVGTEPSESTPELVTTQYDNQASVRVDVSELGQPMSALDATPVSPRPSVAVPTPPVETTLPPPTTGPLDGASVTTVTVPPVPPAPTAPPVAPVAPVVNPSSWSTEAEGVTVTASIQPAQPRVGDTVTISYTTQGAGDFCCWAFVYVDGTIVGQNSMPQGPCPVAPLTSGRATVVVSEPGPFTFQVQGSRMEHFCFGPPVFYAANLFATFDVRPA